MPPKRLYHIIEWIVAIAACVYLVWKLATYDDYAALSESLRGMGWPQWLAIVICVALMPVNMTIEAWRWYSLMNEGVRELKDGGLSFREAHRQVYYSKLAGLITPWRLGEYPARGVLEVQRGKVQSTKSVMAKVLAMGAVGSATMTVAIVAAGVVAMLIDNWQWTMDNGHYRILVGVLLVLLIAVLWFSPRLLRRWAVVSHKLVIKSVGQSMVRLTCWCIQLALVLWALGAISNFPLVIWQLFVYYLFVTITPNVPIAETGIRGAWAIVVFGTVNAALAGVLLWGINTLLPCLIWLFFEKSEQKFV